MRKDLADARAVELGLGTPVPFPTCCILCGTASVAGMIVGVGPAPSGRHHYQCGVCKRTWAECWIWHANRAKGILIRIQEV